MKVISRVRIKHSSCTLDPEWSGFKHYYMGNGHVSLSYNINLNIRFMLRDIYNLFKARSSVKQALLHSKYEGFFFKVLPWHCSPLRLALFSPTYTHLRRPYKHKETCITNYRTSQKLCSKLFKIPVLPARRFVIYPFTAVSGAAQRLIYLV